MAEPSRREQARKVIKEGREKAEAGAERVREGKRRVQSAAEKGREQVEGAKRRVEGPGDQSTVDRAKQAAARAVDARGGEEQGPPSGARPRAGGPSQARREVPPDGGPPADSTPTIEQFERTFVTGYGAVYDPMASPGEEARTPTPEEFEAEFLGGADHGGIEAIEREMLRGL